MDARFEDWLRQAVPTEATFRTKLSELRRIEKIYGDVDTLFDQDELIGLIEDLTYSSEDSRQGRDNPSKLVIDGDLRNNLASYKSAVIKYARFRADLELRATPAPRQTAPSEDRDNWRSDQTFSLEKDLQQALRANITQLEPGLEIADGGAEKHVPSGFIDILARDASGALVVIELKAVKARRDVVGQILAYMGDIQTEHPGTPVRGLLIAPEFEDRVRAAARVVPTLTMKHYSFKFSFEDIQ